MKTTFIHTADLHLGKDFLYSGMSMELARNRKHALWTTLENIFAVAKNNDAVILISGDLFDHSPKSYELYRFLELTEQYSDIDVYLIDGNHDQGMCRDLAQMLSQNSRVHVFCEPGITYVEDAQRNMRVYGACYDASIDMDYELSRLDLDPTFSNILLLHTSLNRSGSRYMPISTDVLIESDFQYIALGHVHNYEIIRPHIRYSGTPEPLGFREDGSHGMIMGTLESDVECYFVRMSCVSFETLRIQLDSSLSARQIEASIVKTLEDYNENVLLRLILSGDIPHEQARLLCDFIETTKFSANILEVKDRTHSSLSHDDALIEAFHEVLNRLELDDKENIRSLGIEAIQRGRECEN